MKLIIIMVGLPARGKSFISNKLYKYFSWLNITTKIFNVGNKRREVYKTNMNDFFDHSNPIYNNIRNKFAYKLYEDLIEWISIDNNNIAIFDATNSTKEKRENLIKMTPPHINILFLESVCNDETIIEKNITLKSNSDDYKDMDKILAYDDFKKRMAFYKSIYQEIYDNESIRYIKVIDINAKYIMNFNNRICKYELLLTKCLFNTNINRKTIYLSRHGQSEYNKKALIGGNSSLSEDGIEYAKLLGLYIKDNITDEYDLYSSTLTRTIETAAHINSNVKHYKCLDEINAGVCEHMTYEEIKLKLNDIYKERKKDKLNYRYPSGESYIDLIERLRDFVFEIEKSKNIIIIIGHQAILRVIYGYLMGISINNIPYIDIDLHTLIKLEPNNYNFNETFIQF